ncbi:MAG: hypoxanthine phosphoribosyltransferase [Pseudohongiellaceae bacterium]|jgi:hypoxanthine phosphoribosyltransferase
MTQTFPEPTMNATPARPDNSQVLYTGKEIAVTVERMAGEISKVYGNEEITVVAVLHGALIFCADLMRELNMPVQLETVSASSYHGASTTSGELSVRVECADKLVDRHVLLVEDILDTGRTLTRLSEEVLAVKPKSLRIAALLDKHERRVTDIAADFVGFAIPDLFVVGYGLDLDGRYRNLPEIRAIHE